MSSQLVDIDNDGHGDILVGSFSGVPQLIRGSKGGYREPEPLTDLSDQTVLIANFWNYDTKKWDTTDRAESEGHCTSDAAVDWDADGDLDLLLGDYYGGRIFLRENQGDSRTPKFAPANKEIKAGGDPMKIESGLAAPRIVDWDGDGLFDILCGGSKGGVYYFRNVGNKTAPQFAAAETLIEEVDDPSSSYVTRVPTKNGQPTMPGSSYHIEAVDYDSDGDLDLLIGARSLWLKESPGELSEEDRQELLRINRELAECTRKLREAGAKATTSEQRQTLVQSDAYRKLLDEHRALIRKRQQYDTSPTETGDFVWLFRRK